MARTGRSSGKGARREVVVVAGRVVVVVDGRCIVVVEMMFRKMDAAADVVVSSLAGLEVDGIVVCWREENGVSGKVQE